MKFKNGFPAVTRIFKRYALAAAGLRYASVEVTGELRLIVAVSVDAGARIDGEGKDLLQVLLMLEMLLVLT